MKRIGFLLSLAILLSCEKKEDPEERLLDSITSASVAFSHSDPQVQAFFTQPSLAYVSGYFYFGDDLAQDVVFGLDIEFLEGVENPIRFEGADWMALAGFSRDGLLWFPIGSPENLEGTPTPTDLWEVIDLGTKLQPNSWYKMTIVCDFDILEFVSVQLEGGDLDRTVSLEGFPLEYPNYAPFDKPSLTGYTFALRSTEFAPDNAPGYDVFFDDIEMGIWNGDDFETVFQDGFENQTAVGEIPITGIPIPLDNIPENQWFLENGNAKLQITNTISRSGRSSLKCAADLRQ